jgi:hypothetical protein
MSAGYSGVALLSLTFPGVRLIALTFVVVAVGERDIRDADIEAEKRCRYYLSKLHAA